MIKHDIVEEFRIANRRISKVNVKGVRNRLGWTQKEMGDYIGVNYHTIGRWEKGHKPSRMAEIQLNKLVDELEEWDRLYTLSEKPKSRWRSIIDFIRRK